MICFQQPYIIMRVNIDVCIYGGDRAVRRASDRGPGFARASASDKLSGQLINRLLMYFEGTIIQ